MGYEWNFIRSNFIKIRIKKFQDLIVDPMLIQGDAGGV